MTFRKAIFEADIESECIDLICELVPIGQPDCENSIDPEAPGAKEQEIAEYLSEILKSLGFEVDLIADVPDRSNVVGYLEGTAAGPTIILNDHLDTYPAGDPTKWTETGGNPYCPTVKGRHIYSRGTSDTRGNLAVIIMALRLLQRFNVKFIGKIVCAFTVDEEKNGKHGAVYLLEKYGLRGDYEITCEPTGWTDHNGEWGMGIALAHSGHCLLDVTVEGTSSHLWRPDVGINANDMMSLLIGRLREVKFTYEDPKIVGPTGPSAIAIRVVGGKIGEGQFTPYVSTARIAVVGLVPGMTQASCVADIEQFLTDLHREQPLFQARVSMVDGETFVAATTEVDPNTAHVKHLISAYHEVLNKEPLLYRKNAYCDTIRFSHAGIPAITFGPGEDGWAPINESIHIDKVIAAVKVMALTIAGLLQGKQSQGEG